MPTDHPCLDGPNDANDLRHMTATHDRVLETQQATPMRLRSDSLNGEVRCLRREIAELRERELRRYDELAAAYQDFDSFSYSLAHDLRAPLRTIVGFAEILEEDFSQGLGEEGRRVVRVICVGARKLDQLIVGLSEFSRVGTTSLHPGHVDMTSVATAAAGEAKAQYEGPAPSIDIGELPDIEGDLTAMRHVWRNLIGNALKYSAKRPQPRISIGGRIENDQAIYHVTDNGAGFDMRYADKLFGIFERLHGSDEFSGSGVGLAIVKRIIMRHGGRIWAEGAPDQGACFQFALPLSSRQPA